MMIDTVLAFFVVRALWHWSAAKSVLFLALFMTVDFAFFSATMVKVLAGGWFPLLIGAVIFTLLTTWKRGRAALNERIRTDTIPLDLFIQSLFHEPPPRVAGTAVFLTTWVEGVPRALLHNLLHNKVLHQRVLLLTVDTADVPYVEPAERLQLESLDFGFWRLRIRYGFKDEPDIPAELARCRELGLKIDLMETSFFLGRETLVSRVGTGMAAWREKLFILLFRNAGSAADYFRIPPNRVIELGTQVEL
jgi:KUP system potassium uptake protein